MSAWTGKWNIDLASATYRGFKVGAFSLKKVRGQAGKYVVTSSSRTRPAKWLGAVFTELPGSGKPTFPWPLPALPTSAQKANAAEYLAEEILDQGQPFDSLQGQVTVNGVSESVHLFKVDRATTRHKDFLVCFKQVDLAQQSAPAGGGASGVRP